jgi:hypothetical protein
MLGIRFIVAPWFPEYGTLRHDTDYAEKKRRISALFVI